jgi:hypothetical protein
MTITTGCSQRSEAIGMTPAPESRETIVTLDQDDITRWNALVERSKLPLLD